MNIFLGIMAVISFLLMFNEKDRIKRKDFKACFIGIIAGMVIANVVNMIF